MFRHLQKHIVAQIFILIIFVLLVAIGLRTSHQMLQSRNSYLRGLLANEQVKVEISHLLQKKLLDINIKLLDMSNANSEAELNRLESAFALLRSETDKALKVIESGGVWQESYPVNFGDEELISRKLQYTNHQKQRINLQVIELRAKLAELDDLVSDFHTLLKTKIDLFRHPNNAELSALIRKVSSYYKGIEPFFVRILENSNRIHFESQLEMDRIRSVLFEFDENFLRIEFITKTTALILFLLLGGTIIRSSQKILLERDKFQNQLLEANENLELTVRERTKALEQEISERKQTQDKLTEQAEFLLNTIEALSHPFYVIDAETYAVVLANSATGIAGRLGETTCHALTHSRSTPCDGKDHPCPLLMVKQTLQPVTTEHIHLNPSGEERIFEVHGYPILDHTGKLTQMIEYSLDITEKKNAEHALQEAHDMLEDKVLERTRELEEEAAQRRKAQLQLAQSELHYRRLIENISDVITIVDQKGTISYVSPSIERLLGFPADKFVRHNTRKLIHQDDLTNENIAALYERHSDSTPMLHRVRSANGDYHIMETSIRKFDQIDGKDEFILISRDITAREMAEEENRKLKMVVEQSPSSVVMTDTEGTIEYVNPAFEKITGYSFQEAVGNTPRILNSGQVADEVFTDLWKTIKSGRIWQGEFINRKKNSELYEESVQVIPITDYRGEIKHFVAVKENISELKRAQRQAESSNRAKSKFLSQMSHELRTPLNAINGFSQLMLKSKKNPLNTKQKEMAEQIHSAGKHLLQLINEVLDLAKIEAGELALSTEAIDPRPVIDDCLSLIQPLAKEYNIDISTSCAEELPLVRADLTRMKQVLLNFLSNAVKYNRPGGTVVVRVVQKPTKQLTFEVEDSGIGIAEEKRKHIFTPFIRVLENPDSVEGSGIGMTITKQLVEAMGGEVDFTSELGTGSTFWFTLPLAISTVKQESGQPAPQSKFDIENVSPEQVKNILYIEDNPANINFMQECLAELSNLVLHVVNSGEDGLALALKQPPDLILIDLNLPGMDGFRTYRQLKGHAETEFIPVIAISADVMEKTRSRVKKLGFYGYLAKPVDVDLLYRTLQEVLEFDR